MKDRILEQLELVEREHDVKVLYACESGSRAWGFPSKDSDYDVRFIYAHHPNWYLSVNVERKRDTIQVQTNDVLDIDGWDLRKALVLFQKSNPPLLEWLGSPTVYLETGSLAGRLRRLAELYHNPTSCAYHYFHMAQNNNSKYLQGETIWIKKYLYVLRPILAILWIERGLGVVPTEFSKLVDAIVEEGTLKDVIGNLVADKIAGKELGVGERIPILNGFLDGEIERLGSHTHSLHFAKSPGMSIWPKCPTKTLNSLFRETLASGWDWRQFNRARLVDAIMSLM